LQALGKIGRIVKIDPDGDIRVKIEEKTWIFSPVCITPVMNPDDAKEIPAIPAAECVDSDAESIDTAPRNGTLNLKLSHVKSLFTLNLNTNLLKSQQKWY
jgi:hypothetical protein